MDVRLTTEDLITMIGQKEVEKALLQKQVKRLQERLAQLEAQFSADQGDPV